MRRFLLAVCLYFLLTSLSLADSNNPPDGYAGEPPFYHTCQVCHFSYNINSGDGLLNLESLTAMYSPGDTLLMTVTLEDEGQSVWGFELTSLDQDNSQAGAFLLMGGNTISHSDNDGDEPDYLKQTAAGTFPGTNQGSWTFCWIAPESGTGPVTFYIAGAAAIGNGSITGDYVYTTSLIFNEEQSAAEDNTGSFIPSAYAVNSIYPNPFNSAVSIELDVPCFGPVTAEVYDLLGRRVRILHSGILPRGRHVMAWHPSTSTGVYYLRVTAHNGWSEARRLVFEK